MAEKFLNVVFFFFFKHPHSVVSYLNSEWNFLSQLQHNTDFPGSALHF